MIKLLNMLKRDKDTISIGRLIAVLSFVLFAGVSLYLAVTVNTWGNYEAFSIACVVYMLVQLGNKVVELRGMKIRSDCNE